MTRAGDMTNECRFPCHLWPPCASRKEYWAGTQGRIPSASPACLQPFLQRPKHRTDGAAATAPMMSLTYCVNVGEWHVAHLYAGVRITVFLECVIFTIWTSRWELLCPCSMLGLPVRTPPQLRAGGRGEPSALWASLLIHRAGISCSLFLRSPSVITLFHPSKQQLQKLWLGHPAALHRAENSSLDQRGHPGHAVTQPV